LAVGAVGSAVPHVLDHLAAGLGSDQVLVDAVAQVALDMPSP
jgi:hypothetical protein